MSKLFKVLLWKAYFDKGFSITNYVKYVIAFIGISSLNTKLTLIVAAIYGLCCLIIGFVWYKYKIIEVENEVNNKFNPFQREVRAKLSKHRLKLSA